MLTSLSSILLFCLLPKSNGSVCKNEWGIRNSKSHRLKGGTNDPHEQKRLAGRGIPCLGSPRLRSLLKKIGENVSFREALAAGKRTRTPQQGKGRNSHPVTPRHKLLLLGFSDAGDEQDGQNPEQLINQDGQGAKLPKAEQQAKKATSTKPKIMETVCKTTAMEMFPFWRIQAASIRIME